MNYKRKHSDFKIRKTIHARPILGVGVGEDEGKFFHCGWCGFPCDKERDSLGGSESRSGVTHENYSVESYPESTLARRLTVDANNIEHSVVMMELDGAGAEKKPEEIWRPVISGGCPLCGCKNWRGDY